MNDLLFTLAILFAAIHAGAGVMMMRDRRPGLSAWSLFTQGAGWIRSENFGPRGRAWRWVYLGAFAAFVAVTVFMKAR